MAKSNVGESLRTLLGTKAAKKGASGKQSKSKALAEKYEKEAKKIKKATENEQPAKNTGSRQQNDGTDIRKTKTGNDNKEPDIPNTTPQSVTNNVYKKGGTVTALGLGAVLGGVGTWLSGITQKVSAVIPAEDPTQEEILDEAADAGTWWDDMNEEAAGLLEGAADIPVLGDVTTAAEEGGWSLPLLIGIVVLVIGAAPLIYKKTIKNKKPAAKKHRKAPAKKPRSTKK